MDKLIEILVSFVYRSEKIISIFNMVLLAQINSESFQVNCSVVGGSVHVEILPVDEGLVIEWFVSLGHLLLLRSFRYLIYYTINYAII